MRTCCSLEEDGSTVRCDCYCTFVVSNHCGAPSLRCRRGRVAISLEPCDAGSYVEERRQERENAHRNPLEVRACVRMPVTADP